MALSHSDVVTRFKDGRQGKGGNMFIQGDVVYSYGTHWPLAIRQDGEWGCGVKYLLNSDYYSVSTSQHLSHCRSLRPHLGLSFTLLRRAGLIERWGHSRPRPGDFAIVNVANDERYWLPKVVLLAKDGTAWYYKGAYRGGTLAKLPHVVGDVESAKRLLLPPEVVEAEQRGLPVIKVGPLCAIPTEYREQDIHGEAHKDYPLLGGLYVTNAIVNGQVYGRGYLRDEDTRRDHKHKQVRFGETWYHLLKPNSEAVYIER